MEMATSIDEMRHRPVGHYVFGRCWLVWCHSLHVLGVAVWGRASEEDVASIERVFAFRHPLPGPLDLVVDVSRLESVERAPFTRLLAYALRREGEMRARVARCALVRPSGFDGAVVAGISALFSSSHRWHVAGSAATAFSWLEHGAVYHEVEALIARGIGAAPSIREVRAHLTSNPSLSVEHVAAALALSTRSLQRQLCAAGTSFRELANEVRAELAARLLTGTDDKVETIARRVGFAGDAQLMRLFRRRFGETPNRYRRRVRGSVG